MCHTHMLIQDPERLLEEEEDDLDQPPTATGADADQEGARWTVMEVSEERA